MISASRLNRIAACPASAVLQQVEHTSDDAARGIAIHRFLEQCAQVGRDAALAEVSESVRATCEAIDVASLPIGEPYQAEVALAFDPVTRTARVISAGKGRNYGGRKTGEIVGTADVVGVVDGRVYVADYKTGYAHDLHSPPAARSLQLRFLALAACHSYGFASAVVELIHIREDGSTWRDRAELDSFDLDAFSVELRRIAERVEKARQTPNPTVYDGPHCRYCPAFAACPKNTALAVRIASEPGELVEEIRRSLTPERAAKAYTLATQAKRLLDEVLGSIYAYATEAGGIDLGDGLVLGPTETKRETVDGRSAFAALSTLHGPEVAMAAVKLDTSKAAIERALRGIADSKRAAGEKVTLKALREEVLERVRESGGITEKVTQTVKVYKKETA